MPTPISAHSWPCVDTAAFSKVNQRRPKPKKKKKKRERERERKEKSLGTGTDDTMNAIICVII